MKAPIVIEQFRIGNIVIYDGAPHYVSHLSLDIDDEYQDLIGVTPLGKSSGEKAGWNRESVIYDHLQPIPITEEWLIKFGFTDNPIAWHKDISTFPLKEFMVISVSLNQGVMIRCGDLNRWREADDVISIINTDIKGPLYVHQLQNLYFALTGEELTPRNT